MNIERGLEFEQESVEFEPSIRGKNVNFILETEIGKKIELEEFQGVYSEEEIQRDRIEVENKKAQFEESLQGVSVEGKERIKRSKERSEALEVVIGDQAELNNWFGENAMVSRTTEYDDIKNGVDAVLEYDVEGREDKRLALGIDASMRTDIESVRKKIDRNIVKLLDKERPAQVKYFKSQVSDYKGVITGIVPIVIGMEGKNSDSLFALFSQTRRLERSKKNQELLDQKRKDLEFHPAQRIFLEQISIQLTMYKTLLEGKVEYKEVLDQVNEMQSIIEEVRQGKEEISLDDFEDDAVSNAIKVIAEKK